jgi:hypothetical protein
MGTTPVVIDITLDIYRRTLPPFVLKYAAFLRRFHTFSNPGANTRVFVRQGDKQSTRGSLLAFNPGKLQRNDNAMCTSAASLLGSSRLKGYIHR